MPDHDPNRTTDHRPHDTSDDPDRTGPHTPVSVPGPDGTPDPAAVAPSIPGYAIEGVLGRGGMGVVYRARHLALKRTVALKVVLAGGHAGPRELVRFRIEAEAVARLQHPNIVQIHEVGGAGGHPYCALEFVDGGTLERRVAGRPMPAREAAALVGALARAMQLAHSRNIVHRDLKPANVLLAADGTPKVTDFGLARQLDADSGETQAGAVMGTPSYMAPEQAAGRAHEAGPAADVYALGAILYACLTGRPPFKGATAVETLDQVRTREPVPPSRVRPGVPLDLETICLKCLHKEPENRYPSAAELSDDLGRFRRGEPIQARLAGRAERAAKWVRRNPVPAAALAAVAAALVAATGVSTWFGVQTSEKNAELEQANAKLEGASTEVVNKNVILVQKEAEVNRQNAELLLGKQKLEQANDRLRGALAEAWLSPLSEAAGSSPAPAEVAAFHSVAALDDRALADRYVREAVGPRWRRKLGARAEFALHAAIGLDAGKRQEVERLLLGELDRLEPADEARADLALAAAALGGLSPPAATAVAKDLLRALTRETDPGTLRHLGQAVSAVAGRLDPKEATRVCSEAATTLTRSLARSLDQANAGTDDPTAITLVALGLEAVAPLLEPAAAAGLADTLTRAMTAVTGAGLRERGRLLAVVATRLAPADAARSAERLVRVVSGPGFYPPDGPALTQALSALVGRLGPEAVATTAAPLLQALPRPPGGDFSLKPLCQGLAALAPGLGAAPAADAAAALAKHLTPFHPAAQELAQALAAVAGRMKPAEAAAVLTRAMAGMTSGFVLQHLARGLAAVAGRLEPGEAVATAAELTKVLANPSLDPFVIQQLVVGLAAVAARLDPRAAAEAATTLLGATARMLNSLAPEEIERALPAVVARLEPGAADRLAADVVARLARAWAGNRNDVKSLALWATAVAGRLEPGPAAGAAATLAAALPLLAEDVAASRPLARALSAVAGRMTPGDAARVCSPAATELMRAIANPRPRHPAALPSMAECLATVAVHLEPAEAARARADAATALGKAVADTTDPDALQYRVRGLVAVTTTMGSRGPSEAAEALMRSVARNYRPNPPSMAFPSPPDAQHTLSAGLAAILTVSRLSDQELVDLLKLPLCVGPARRAVLDQLGSRHRRTFADQWDFARFAGEKGLRLDLKSPPRPSAVHASVTPTAGHYVAAPLTARSRVRLAHPGVDLWRVPSHHAGSGSRPQGT